MISKFNLHQKNTSLFFEILNIYYYIEFNSIYMQNQKKGRDKSL